MFSISLADGLLLLEVESDDGLIGLLDRLLLLDAFQMLLLVLRDLLCVDIKAVSRGSLGGRGRVSVPSSRDAVASQRWRPLDAVDATLHTNHEDAGAAPSRSSVNFCVR